MMNILLFGSLAVYFVAIVLQFGSSIFKKEKLKSVAWWVLIAAFALHTAFIVVRGIVAKRLPLSNQFEFATAFAWGVSLLYIFVHLRFKIDWMGNFAIPAAFLLFSYAALVTPREITEMMPALRSAWFGLHIGAAVFSYASFAISACMGLRYLWQCKKGADETGAAMKQIDYLSYRMIAFGFLMLTVVILSGCVWAEQAWSTFWSWDPKETWALITWIMYAIYLHQRLRKKWQGKRMAWFSVIAIICVLFTFAGVNLLLPGLHSYA